MQSLVIIESVLNKIRVERLNVINAPIMIALKISALIKSAFIVTDIMFL